MSENRKIKVLVVDDSALIRSVMKEIIDREKDMECIGAAPDPLVAREMIKELNPDVLTLDVEMPKMDGLDFLERLMRLRPMPVVMVSTLTERGSDITFKALALGAVDFVSKPKMDISRGMEVYASEIVDKIRAAAQSKVHKSTSKPSPGLLGAETYLSTGLYAGVMKKASNGTVFISTHSLLMLFRLRCTAAGTPSQRKSCAWLRQ